MNDRRYDARMGGAPYLRAVLVVAFPIAVALGTSACGSGSGDANLIHGEHVAKATFHGTWPITSDAGTLACDATKGGSITFSPDGSSDTYAVNGTAMGWAPKEGWKDFHEIWLANTGDDSAGPNVNSSDFDAEGQKLCSENK
jgi:hypothetical protein